MLVNSFIAIVLHKNVLQNIHNITTQAGAVVHAELERVLQIVKYSWAYYRGLLCLSRKRVPAR
jgi:hypothetical protein